MEKVIMLPRLPGLKKVIFTRRFILFHETFAPLGGAQNDKKSQSVSYGTRELQVAMMKTSLVHTLKLSTILITGTMNILFFWADNCTAQNKNWTLFSALLYEVNQSSNNCQSVRMKYFEKGHTFMAADSFHKAVEDVMREKKIMYDFDDFQSVINSKGTSHIMDHSKFTQYTKEVSKAHDTNYPKIEDIVK